MRQNFDTKATTILEALTQTMQQLHECIIDHCPLQKKQKLKCLLFHNPKKRKFADTFWRAIGYFGNKHS